MFLPLHLFQLPEAPSELTHGFFFFQLLPSAVALRVLLRIPSAWFPLFCISFPHRKALVVPPLDRVISPHGKASRLAVAIPSAT